ncbi:MAG: four helix bundle protein [Desulfobacteria bacterium]
MRNKRRTQKKVAGRGSGSRRKNEKKDVQHTNLKERTKEFALRIIEFVETLPRGRTTDVIGGQLLRAGTSVGANYRSSCRARSPADFIAKMGIVEEEADESLYWMELLIEAGIVKPENLEALMKEGDELLAITVASINTARRGRKR